MGSVGVDVSRETLHLSSRDVPQLRLNYQILTIWVPPFLPAARGERPFRPQRDNSGFQPVLRPLGYAATRPGCPKQSPKSGWANQVGKIEVNWGLQASSSRILGRRNITMDSSFESRDTVPDSNSLSFEAVPSPCPSPIPCIRRRHRPAVSRETFGTGIPYRLPRQAGGPTTTAARARNASYAPADDSKDDAAADGPDNHTNPGDGRRWHGWRHKGTARE